MRTRCLMFVMGFLLIAAPASDGFAGAHGKRQALKKGILLVTFGSSIPEAQIAFENIDRQVRKAFPDVPVRWAYTSHMIRHKLAKEGKQLDSVEIALARMMDERFTHVAVQSLHTIGGEEFHDLQRNADLFARMAGGIEHIVVGYPLLGTADDLRRAAEAMIRHIPPARKKDEAVILMGHGTPHPSNAFYAAFMYHLQRVDPNIFVGTVEGFPGIDDIKEILLKKGTKRAYLIPFMSVAGDHARNDMAGVEEDSWTSILTKAGIDCVPILKGTAEYNDIVDIWIDHLRSSLSRF